MKRQHNKDNLIGIKVNIEEGKLLDTLLGYIEETENSDLILEITKWLISEVGNWGGSMAEDANILKVIELLRDYK